MTREVEGQPAPRNPIVEDAVPNAGANGWYQILVEDKSAGPADTACSRIDFGDWLGQLPRRNRRIAEFLALNHRTDDTARKFKGSSGRISQVRKELADNWKRFIGDEEGPATLAV